MFTATLIVTYALSTNVPLYVREQGPPYRESGVRLELHKTLPYNFYFDLDPYIWNGRGDRIGNGGAIARLGWMGKYFGVSFLHQSEHNFDRKTLVRHIEFDAIEVRWRMTD